MSIDIANMIVNIGQNNPKTLVDIFSALLTPLIAIIMAYITWQQWKTSEKKRKQDLFNLRYDNLFLPILSNSKRYDMYEKEKFENLDWDKKEELDKQFSKQLHKYKFLINQSDFEKLMEIHVVLCTLLKKEDAVYNDKTSPERYKNLGLIYGDLEKQLTEMDEIIGQYLRVEEIKIQTLWLIIVNLCKWVWCFLAIDKIIDFFKKLPKEKTPDGKSAD